MDTGENEPALKAATIATYKGTVAVVALYSAVALVVMVSLFFEAGRTVLLEDWRAFTLTLLAGIVGVSTMLLVFLKTVLKAPEAGKQGVDVAAAEPPEDLVACPDYWTLSVDPSQPIPARYKCTPSPAAFGSTQPTQFSATGLTKEDGNGKILVDFSAKITDITTPNHTPYTWTWSQASNNTSNLECHSTVYPVAWARADRAANCGASSKGCNPTLGRCTTAEVCGYTWSAVCKN